MQQKQLMKKTLLNASGNVKSKKENVFLRNLFLAFAFLSIQQNITAQCIGPFQGYESIPASAAALTSTVQATNPVYYTNPWGIANFSIVATGSNVRTGRNALAQPTPSMTTATITSPLINTPSTFAFYGKYTGGSGIPYALQFSDDGGTTWYTVAAGTNNVTTALNTISVTGTLPTLTTTYQEIKVSAAFPATANGYKFRIADVRISGTAGAFYVDDISWTSSTAAQNNIIVPLLNSAAICTPAALDVTRTYYLYDVGGENDTYSASQDNSVVLTPNNSAYKTRLTTEAFNTTDANDYFQVYNDATFTTQAGGNYSGTTGPSYTSSDANGSLSVRFVSNTGLPAAANLGYKIKIDFVGCATPTAFGFVANGGISHDSAFLTWSGTSSNYDIYYSTSNIAPNSGTLPTATSTLTSATIGGLTASTTYYFWVRSNCGGSTSAWTASITGTTLCIPRTITYFENFNGFVGGALPACTSTDDAANWKTNSVNGNLYGSAIGTNFYTEGVTLTAGQMYRLSYDYSTLVGDGAIEVLVGHPTNNSAPNGANIASRVAYNTFSTVVSTEVVNFTASANGTYYVRFFLDDLQNGATTVNIDNIRIELETCLPPTFPGTPVSAIGNTVATVSWNVPSTGVPSNGYSYYLSTTNVRPNFSDTGNGTSATTSVALNSLAQFTTYYVWVRSDCGGQVSGWSLNPAVFTTTGSLAATVKISDSGSPYQINCNNNYTFVDSNSNVYVAGTSNVGDYRNYENYTYTFVPDAAGLAAGAKLMVVFQTFNTENKYDGLMIYSGMNTGGTLMSSGRAVGDNATTCPAGAYSGTESPGTILSTAANGSLTFQFRSDVSIVRPGWSASIVCITGIPTITSFTPTHNSCGSPTTVVITGTNLTSVTGVAFNGTAAPAGTFTINGAGTQITVTLPAGATTGKIKLTAVAGGFPFSVLSTTNFTVNNPPPAATGALVCQGSTGTLTSSAACDISGVTTFNGTITAGPAVSNPDFSGTTCSFTGSNSWYYTATQIMVSVTGTYSFASTSTLDIMAYITRGNFTPGSCATGTYIIGDDDGAGSLQPLLTANLTAGVVYTLYTTTYWAFRTGTYTWTVTPPVGGSVTLYQSGQVQWYTVASGGSPIGTGSSFNPIGVAGSPVLNNTTNGTWTFYAACSSNPTCRTAVDFTISAPTPGTASSDQNICAGAAADVTLTGNAAVPTKWQYASNAGFTVGVTDIPSSNSATLTSAQIGLFTGTRYFRAQIVVGTCTVYSNVITITYIDKVIWNGASWSNGTGPTSSIGADFQGNYTSSVNASATSGNLSACSVTVTSGNVLFDIGTLTVQNSVAVAGGASLQFENNASLYQVANVANAPGVYSGGNSGNIRYKRTTTGIRQFDYTYWSTPVNPQTLVNVSPDTPFDAYYYYDTDINNWQYIASNSLMEVGKGYIIRAPYNYDINTPANYTATFIGTPNNGTITTPIAGGASQMNLIGNPYPSSLSASAFITDPANTNLNGTLYFWTHNTPINAAYQYTGSDYAIYNLVGGTSAATNPPVGSGGSSAVPLGYIASGQSFFVKGFSSGTATFRNSMRAAGNNSQFYRLSPYASNNMTDELSLEKHRYWLNITNTEGAYKQTLVGYVETATNGIDRLFDGEMVDVGNAVTLYTMVGNTKLSIQGKALSFDVNETIPLGYKSTINSTYTISLPDFDGLFENQKIYLEDKLLNVIHDLKVSPYTFTTEIGTFDTRFVLRYTTETLGVDNPVFNANTVIVYQNNSGLHINSGTQNMKNVTIYDVRGREIASKKQIGSTAVVFTTLPLTQQVLLVKIEGENGGTVTKKIVY